ncbi:hypothetical protein [Pectobacterium parmentieri]|nr:hypothetical protein [Pectobacterium parmentieri]POW24536.1 hypothetical protein PB20LOC_03861 [Pectobacterium parmentieri]
MNSGTYHSTGSSILHAHLAPMLSQAINIFLPRKFLRVGIFPSLVIQHYGGLIVESVQPFSICRPPGLELPLAQVRYPQSHR